METCGICGKEFGNYRGLSSHISYKHKGISSKRYYNLYLRKEDEGICPICGKETSFFNISYGYRKFCSYQCRAVSEDTKKKYIQTMLETYGVTNSLKLKSVQDKAHTKEASLKQVEKRIANQKKNGTLPQSKDEKDLLKFLEKYFEKDDIETWYKSVEYPWFCDFYIKSRNLYIELNSFSTHETHLYGTIDSDEEKLKSYRESTSPFYQSVAKVWLSDLEKWNRAVTNKLKYIVIYDVSSYKDKLSKYLTDETFNTQVLIQKERG